MGLLRRKRGSTDRPSTPVGNAQVNAGIFARIFGRKPSKTPAAARDTARKRRSMRIDSSAPYPRRGHGDEPPSALAPPSPPFTAASAPPSFPSGSPSAPPSAPPSVRSSMLPEKRTQNASLAPPPPVADRGFKSLIRKTSSISLRGNKGKDKEKKEDGSRNSKRFSTSLYDKLSTSRADDDAGSSATVRAPPTARPGLLAATEVQAANQDDAPPPLPPKSSTIGYGAAAEMLNALRAAEALESPAAQERKLQKPEPLTHQSLQAPHSPQLPRSPLRSPQLGSPDTEDSLRATSPTPRPAVDTLDMSRPLSLAVGGRPGANLVRGRSINGPGKSVTAAVTTVTTTGQDTVYVSPPDAVSVSTPSPSDTSRAGTPVRAVSDRGPVLKSPGLSRSRIASAEQPLSVTMPRRESDFSTHLSAGPMSPGIVIPAPVEGTVGYIGGPADSAPASPQSPQVQSHAVPAAGIASAAAVGAASAAVFAEPKDDEAKLEKDDEIIPKTAGSEVHTPVDAPEAPAAAPEDPSAPTSTTLEAPALSLPFDSRPLSAINLSPEQGPANSADASEDNPASGAEAPSQSIASPPLALAPVNAEMADSPTDGLEASPVSVSPESSSPRSPPVFTTMPVVDTFSAVTRAAKTESTAVSTPTVLLDSFIPPLANGVKKTKNEANDEDVVEAGAEAEAKAEIGTQSTRDEVDAKVDEVETKAVDAQVTESDEEPKAAAQPETTNGTADPEAVEEFAGTDEAAAQKKSSAPPTLPSISVMPTYELASDEESDDTPPLSPGDAPIVTAEFKAATALSPIPAVPPKDTVHLGTPRPNGVNSGPTPRTPSVGTATTALAAMATSDTSPASMSPATPPAPPEKEGGLYKSLGVRSVSTPSPSPQRALSARMPSDGQLTPSSFKPPRSPTTPRSPSTPGTPGSVASDATLDDFMGLFKTVITRDKGMTIRDAARMAEHRTG